MSVSTPDDTQTLKRSTREMVCLNRLCCSFPLLSNFFDSTHGKKSQSSRLISMLNSQPTEIELLCERIFHQSKGRQVARFVFLEITRSIWKFEMSLLSFHSSLSPRQLQPQSLDFITKDSTADVENARAPAYPRLIVGHLDSYRSTPPATLAASRGCSFPSRPSRLTWKATYLQTELHRATEHRHLSRPTSSEVSELRNAIRKCYAPV